MECSFCNKVCKNDNSLRNHERLCKMNPNRQVLKSNFVEYNKKLKSGEVKKLSSNQIVKARLENREYVVSDETRNKLRIAASGKKKSKETLERLRVAMQLAVKRNPDSYTKNNVSGRTPLIEYNGVKLKGSWEVLVAKWLDSQQISWTNDIIGIPYNWNNTTHLYYPDFYLPEFNCYIEVKGYQRERDVAKWSVVDNLIVIKQHEITKIKSNSLKFMDVYGPLAKLVIAPLS